MANKNKKEEKNEFERRICENMGNGFEWNSANWSILKITKIFCKEHRIER